MRVKTVFRGYSMKREDCNQCGGFGCHWCLSEAELSELRQPTASTDHTGDANEMVHCPACGTKHEGGGVQAEFIGWHGKCSQCELESEWCS